MAASWNEASIQRLATKLLTKLKVKNARADIFLIGNAHITRLKARFIKKKTEPNVLAFPEPSGFPHPESEKKYLGEIYLNKDILRSSPDRAAPLLLHGLLHLLGYDHKAKKDIVKMEGLEKKILNRFRA